MILDRKVKRTMLESKSQYLGSLVLIIICCLLYTLFSQLSINMARLASSFESKYAQEDVSLITDKPLDDLGTLESRFRMSIEATETLDYPIAKGKILRIFSENKKVDIPAVIDGKPLTRGGILIDPAFAKANELRLGDTIKVYGKAYDIDGFMSLPNYIYTLKSENDILNDPKSFGTAVIDKTAFAGIDGSSYYAIDFHGDKGAVDRNKGRFRDYLRSHGIAVAEWLDSGENPRITFVTAKLMGIDKVSSSMPLAITLLTCILTGIVMWRMLQRETAIIGTLYALGYRRSEIMKHYLMYPFTIAAAGSAIGTILGALALKPMLDMMVMYFNMPVDTVRFEAGHIAVSLLFPLLLLVLCAYLVINKALKRSPADLMRGMAENGKVGWLERKVKLDRFRFAAKYKVREQLRSIPRSLFLLAGVVLATMLLLFGFTAKSSIDHLMTDAVGKALQFKYHYVFNSLHLGRPPEGESFNEALFTQDGGSMTFAVYGVEPDSKYLFLEDGSSRKMDVNKVIITRSLADKLSVDAHDSITIVSRLDSKKYRVRVDAIAETYAVNNIYMPLKAFNRMLGYPSDSYGGLFSSRRLNIPKDQLLTVVTIDDMRSALGTMVQPLQATIGTMAFLSFMIGLIVIYIVTSLTIEENKGNISLMKVFGYKNKEIYSLILSSSSFLVVMGYLLGVPLLIASLDAMFGSITRDMRVSIPIAINYGLILMGFIVIYLTYELTKLLSRRKVDRISMAEALKAGTE